MNWIDVKDQSDIDNLLKKFGYFHDGCLKELHMWTGSYVSSEMRMATPWNLDTNVRVLFQRQMQDLPAIELLFEEVTGIHIIPSGEDYFSIIMDAIILKHNDNIYWADCFDWHPEEEGYSNVSWISAKKLKWRDASDWLGGQNRYGVIE